MSGKRIAISILMFAAVAARADNVVTLFADAGRSYDAGDFAAAERAYRDMIAAGHASPAVLFNLGNALFKQGRYGDAVLAYRRAWYLNPRDADIRANLALAQRETNAASDAPVSWKRPFLFLSAPEWRAVALSSYWLGALAFGAHLATRRRFAAMRRLSVVLAAALGLSLCGLAVWSGYASRPEAVILQGPRQALYAPLEGATPHFAMEAGSIATVMDRSDDWVRLRLNGKSGWVPASSCAAVWAPDEAGLPSS